MHCARMRRKCSHAAMGASTNRGLCQLIRLILEVLVEVGAGLARTEVPKRPEEFHGHLRNRRAVGVDEDVGIVRDATKRLLHAVLVVPLIGRARTHEPMRSPSRGLTSDKHKRRLTDRPGGGVHGRGDEGNAIEGRTIRHLQRVVNGRLDEPEEELVPCHPRRNGGAPGHRRGPEPHFHGAVIGRHALRGHRTQVPCMAPIAHQPSHLRVRVGMTQSGILMRPPSRDCFREHPSASTS